MIIRSRTGAVTLAVLLLMPLTAIAQEHDHGPANEKLGHVEFANSCAPAVQADFQRAVAMLHSFRYIETEKTFNSILARDPNCAMAAWGLASILMTNPLTGIGPPPDKAAPRQEALAKARKIGGPTDRERAWIEAVGAYYEDWSNRPERVLSAL